jgi:hypothetical protein
MDDTHPTVRPSWARRIATGISGSVLGAVTVAASYFVGVALLTPQPSGPGDTDAIDGARMASSLGAGLAMVGALLAVGTVGAGWLRARWLALPVVLLVAALLRFHAVPR